jgi:peptidoglycan/xylan/chitin deacetylase (PgdA/CDA1 family)
MSRLKDHLYTCAFRTIVWSGAHRWARSVGQGMGVILTMHHVKPPEEAQFDTNALLSITPEFLETTLKLIRAEGYDLVDLDEAARRIQSGYSPRFFVALTFDDGYRDNIIHALPILRRYEAPWTFFVCTGFADRTASLWWLELEAAIRVLDHVRLELPDGVFDRPTTSIEQKINAFSALYWRLRPGSEAQLRKSIAELCRQSGVDGRALVEKLCLSWDDLGVLANEPGLTIGAHTRTHPMLARLDEANAIAEIETSRDEMTNRIGKPIRHFAYPVGDKSAAATREFAMCEKAGFATAVTTRPGHLWPEHAGHMTALPRVSLNGFHQNETALKALFSGLPFWALNRARKIDIT